jgi:hypothetical protein
MDKTTQVEEVFLKTDIETFWKWLQIYWLEMQATTGILYLQRTKAFLRAGHHGQAPAINGDLIIDDNAQAKTITHNRVELHMKYFYNGSYYLQNIKIEAKNINDGISVKAWGDVDNDGLHQLVIRVLEDAILDLGQMKMNINSSPKRGRKPEVIYEDAYLNAYIPSGGDLKKTEEFIQQNNPEIYKKWTDDISGSNPGERIKKAMKRIKIKTSGK